MTKLFDDLDRAYVANPGSRVVYAGVGGQGGSYAPVAPCGCCLAPGIGLRHLDPDNGHFICDSPLSSERLAADYGIEEVTVGDQTDLGWPD